MSNESINLNQNHIYINNKLQIIWIDKKIGNEENQSYIKDLKLNKKYGYFNISSCELHEFTDLNKAIEQIKNLRFIDTFIIISAGLLTDFVKKFKDNLKDIYIIPKILFFPSLARKFDDEILKDKFYSGTVITTYAQLKSVINSYQLYHEQLITRYNQYKNNQYKVKSIFIQIKTKDDLKLLEYYHKLVDGFKIEKNQNFIGITFNDYKNDPKYKSLLNQMINLPNIPIELLAKYYARIYSIDGDFYKK